MAKKKKDIPAPVPAGPPPAQPVPAVPPTPAPAPSAAASTSRRDFLARAGSAAAGVAGLATLAGSIRFAVPEIESGPARRFLLGAPSDFKMGTLTWLRERELFVLRDEGGFGAFSSRCTHLGCTVRRIADGFACPCHGARYDARGVVVAGPARRALPWFRLAADASGRLWVDTGDEVAQGTLPLAPVADGKKA